MRSLLLVFALFSFLLACCHARYVPVYVMLPLDIISPSSPSVLAYPTQLSQWFTQLKQGGVDGVMTDFWWGIVEKSGPKQYNWDAYLQLLQLAQQSNLTMQVVMSFHQCGGNPNDACDIPLPSFVVNDANAIGAWYTDANGNTDPEYISLGADNVPFPSGRTPLQMYFDFMSNFVSTFTQYLGTTILEVEIGMGPAGELRYPAYQSSHWNFPGVGEFQCYDKYMKASLQQAANLVGQPTWATAPTNAGSYNDVPSNTQFFSDNGGNNWSSAYGVFFLSWYSQILVDHAHVILANASIIFQKTNVKLAGKIAGIHWWYLTDSHAAELTAGYYTVANTNGYAKIAKLFATFNTTFDFTCMEMRDSEQPTSAKCGPEELVNLTQMTANGNGIEFSGENALPRYDSTAYQTIVAKTGQNDGVTRRFTYLRLDSTLMSSSNFGTFTNFVNQMHNL